MNFKEWLKIDETGTMVSGGAVGGGSTGTGDIAGYKRTIGAPFRRSWPDNEEDRGEPKCQQCGQKIRRNEPHSLCSKCRVALYTSSMDKT